MNVTAQKFQSLYVLVRKPSARSNHRTTLPQSRPLGVPAPSEREPGMVRSPPAPSLRELSSERETEGVYYDERIRSNISEPKWAGV